MHRGGNANTQSVSRTKVTRNIDDLLNKDEELISLVASRCRGFENTELMGPIVESFRESLLPGVCLICIEDVERKEAVWNCKNCFCTLHLVCIQRWAKDSISNVKELAAERGFNIPIVWCCPKCRGEYGDDEYPSSYSCYCKKLFNPPDDPWNSPHSCGDVCAKQLKNCEHFCSLICHAGPCPQCPKQVSQACFCGTSSPRILRCYVKEWSCPNECSKNLICGFHKCRQQCHPAACPKCDVTVTLSCKCSSPQKVDINCEDLARKCVAVSCGSICGKPLQCKSHQCKQICHDGGCGPCVVSCPCGKHKVECTGKSTGGNSWQRSCGETCLKLLECGVHYCQDTCHARRCGECLEMTKKRCKCGSYENEIQCSKEFTCTTRCGKIKNCGLHNCNKKCCPGDCAYSCTKTCLKTLQCKNHKCQGVCGHRGLCFPCPVSAPVKCRCGETVIFVPCGSEKRVKPPSCQKLCALKTKCDHPQIQAHKCHFGDCPRCTRLCGKKLDCGHDCIAKCHTFKTHRKLCPPCPQLVPSKCPLHLETQVACSEQNNACQDICEKHLECGVHICLKKCHLRVQGNCGVCNESCQKERTCEHTCLLGCHLGPCSDCTLIAKVSCHCGTDTLFATCYRKNNLSEMEKSCKNQCIGKLSCGHRCLQICHSGSCPETDRCRRKVKLTCKCRRLKKDLDCYQVEKRILDCIDPPCQSVLSPKISVGSNQGSEPRKRNRKSRTSESDIMETKVVDELDTVELVPTKKFSWIYIAVAVLIIALTSTMFTFLG